MSHLGRIFEKYEEVGKHMLDVDLEVDDTCDMTNDTAKMGMEAAEKTEMAAMTLEKARERHRNVAQVFEASTAATLCAGGSHRGRRGTDARSASP